MPETPETPETPDAPAAAPAARDPNHLFARVDALMKRQQEESQRAVEEVPVLTEEVDPGAPPAAPAPPVEEALAADIERVLVVRLIPELNRQVATLRTELEKQLRRSVREAVEHALAARNTPTKEP